MGEFYQTHPYPPPVDDLDAYRRAWNDARRRADSHLFWPSEAYRDDRSILVAGCGSVQAAHYAVRWPRARVVGIDVSETSLAFSRELKGKHALENLELARLAIEDAAQLGETFEHIVATGVLHHLPDPAAGLRALRGVLERDGAMHLMLYAPYGRAGIYLLQEYARRLHLRWSVGEIRDLVATLKALPPDHPIAPLLRSAPDFATPAGVADALLHPNDRPYSVPQVLELLESAGLRFGRWLRQAPYLACCGAIASTPHAAALTAMPDAAEHAAMELFRGSMTRHSAIAHRSDRDAPAAPDFEDALEYVPVRLPETVAVRERLPAGAAAVLINRSHTFTDLYLPVDAARERFWNAIDGARTIRDICAARADAGFALDFVRALWRWDQVVFDTSRSGRAIPS